MKKINFRCQVIFVVGALLLLTPELFAGVGEISIKNFIMHLSAVLLVGIFARVLLTFGMPIWGAILASILTYIAAVAITYFMEHRHSYNKRMEKYKKKTPPPVSSTLDPSKDMNLTSASLQGYEQRFLIET